MNKNVKGTSNKTSKNKQLKRKKLKKVIGGVSGSETDKSKLSLKSNATPLISIESSNIIGHI